MPKHDIYFNYVVNQSNIDSNKRIKDFGKEDTIVSMEMHQNSLIAMFFQHCL